GGRPRLIAQLRKIVRQFVDPRSQLGIDLRPRGADWLLDRDKLHEQAANEVHLTVELRVDLDDRGGRGDFHAAHHLILDVGQRTGLGLPQLSGLSEMRRVSGLGRAPLDPKKRSCDTGLLDGGGLWPIAISDAMTFNAWDAPRL